MTTLLTQLAGDRPPCRIGYVLKRYPRFSETFVVNEILAHEAAGVEVEVFALNPSCDTHFQPEIASVRAPVRYLRAVNVRATEFWTQLQPWLAECPQAVARLVGAVDAEGPQVHQALEMAAAVRARGIQHLHAHFATSATTVARLAALLTGIPYTFTAHAKDIYHESVDPVALGQKIRDAAAVITVSGFNVRQLVSQYPAARHKIVRIFNGMPLERLPTRSERPDGNPTPLIVSVGRLVEKKGFGDLIRACEILQSRSLDFRCVIAGGGDLAVSLQQQVEDTGLQERVELVGPLPSQQVRRLLHQADLLVAPCVTAASGDRDGMPTILLEAMASGTPCVATDVTGIPEIVRPEETGLLVPQRRPDLLAEAIVKVLRDRQGAQRLAQRARQMIEAEFDGVRTAAALRQVFRKAQAGEPLWAEAV